MLGADSCRAIRCVSTLALLSQRIGLPNGLLEATLAWLVCLAERLLPSDSLAALARWVGVPTAVSPQGRCPLGEVPPEGVRVCACVCVRVCARVCRCGWAGTKISSRRPAQLSLQISRKEMGKRWGAGGEVGASALGVV